MEDFYMKYFWDLSTTRNYSEGYIPWNCILQYGHHVGLDDDMFDAFVSIMRTMDEGYLGWQIDQAEKRREQNQEAQDTPTVVPDRRK